MSYLFITPVFFLYTLPFLIVTIMGPRVLTEDVTFGGPITHRPVQVLDILLCMFIGAVPSMNLIVAVVLSIMWISRGIKKHCKWFIRFLEYQPFVRNK